MDERSKQLEDALYGEMYGLIYFFIEEMSGCRGEEEIRKICRQIYKNRKKLGLFTLDDLEIDEKKLDIRWDIFYDEDVDPVIKWWLNGEEIKVTSFKDLAKAIVDKNPIKIKDK